MKDSDIPRQSGHTGQRQMEKSCTGGARTSPTRCGKQKPVTKPSASQVACYVVTSAFGGAQRPGHRRWGSLGEAGRAGALGSMHRLRPQLCPLRGPGQQRGTESRSDTPPGKHQPPRCLGSGSYSHNVLSTAFITPAREARDEVAQAGQASGSLAPAPRPPPRGFCFQFALGSEGAARPGPCCPHLPLDRMLAPSAPWGGT